MQILLLENFPWYIHCARLAKLSVSFRNYGHSIAALFVFFSANLTLTLPCMPLVVFYTVFATMDNIFYGFSQPKLVNRDRIGGILYIIS